MKGHRLHTKRSIAWNYFAEIGGGQFKCGFCQKVLSYKGGSVFNLTRHLRIFHSAQCDLRVPRKPVRQLFSTPMRCPPLLMKIPKKRERAARPHRSENFQEADDSLVKLIVRDYHGVSMLESNEFVELIRFLNPDYKVPTRKEFLKQLLPRMYEKRKEEIETYLSYTEHVTISTYHWTSADQKHFISMLVHFIGDDCRMTSFFLDCFQIDPGDSAATLSEEMQNVLKDWKLDAKIVAIVCNNKMNMADAIHLTGFHYIPSVYGTLMEVLDESIEDISEIIGKVHEIADFLSSNLEAEAIFKRMQEDVGMKVVRFGKTDPTKWNSVRRLFQNFLTVKDAIDSMMETLKEELDATISSSDWKLIEDCSEIFSLLHEAVTTISSEKGITIAKAMITISSTCTTLAEVLETQQLHKMAHKIASEFLEETKTRYKRIENNNVCGEAMLLDPRYKKTVFTSLETYNKAFQSLIKRASKFESSPRKHAAGNNEVTKYIQEPYQDHNGDPLVWWRDRKVTYPALYDLMTQRLCILATTVPADPAFTKRGYLINEADRGLQFRFVTQILFLNHNL